MSACMFAHLLCVAAYTAGFALSVSAFVRQSTEEGRRAVPFIVLGLILQGITLVLYAHSATGLPVARPFGFFSLYALMAFATSLLACRHWNIGGAGFLLQVIPLSTTALLLVVPDPMPSPKLSHGLLALHLAAVLVAMVAFTLAFSAAAMLFLQDRLIKAKSVGFLMHSLPPLAVLDEVTGQNVAFGFVFLSAAVLLGMVGAEPGLGTYALSSPKVLITMAVWMVYGYSVFSRIRSGWHGRRLAVWALAGFLALVAASLAANYFPGVLPGAHESKINTPELTRSFAPHLTRGHWPLDPADCRPRIHRGQGRGGPGGGVEGKPPLSG